MPLTPGERLGQYEIVGPLGAGGMGEVYRARDLKLNREVAIKVLPGAVANDAQYMARFEREAQLLASLNHPNIAAIYGIEQGAIVMELVEGNEPAGPLPLDTAIEYARQIAAGLEAAHEKGVIHRDLKPANIKVTPGGAVKLLDFGLAKATDASSASAAGATMSPTLSLAMTQAGMILGTAAYMAPEQARGHIVDRRADVWAFGVVLFELLTGKPAFPGDTVTDILASVIKLQPDWGAMPPTIPPPIRKLVTRCLVNDRQKRLQAIGEARLALEEYQADPAKAMETAPATAPLSPPHKPWPWMALSAALLIALVALALVHVRETPPPERVLRFTIPLPEKSQLTSFAISPDGRYLAIAATQEGKRQIWLRALDTLSLREVRGSEDANLPFWAPDSRSFAFFAGGKLKRAGVDGSPPIVLCDVVAPLRGGTWSADGTILFSAGLGLGNLKKVSAAGGVAVAVSADQRRTYPSFLAGGPRFLYTVGASGSVDGVYLGSLLGQPDGQPPQQVLLGETAALWAPPLIAGAAGYLVFPREGTLMAQPANSKTLKLEGELFPIAEQVSLVGNRAQASISETGVLAYWTGSLSTSQLTWFDRSGQALGSRADPAVEVGLALSPDGNTVAVARAKGANASDSDLWFHELARGVDTRFTLDAAGSRSPVWSPDGRRIVYSANRKSAPTLFLGDTNGSGRHEMLLPPGSSRFATDWSKDGRILIWEETGKGYDLWYMNMEGERKPVPFANSEFNETQGQLSPDGRWLAYASDESGRYEIYVRPFPTGAGKWRVSVNGGDLPRWSGDGKEIFYLTSDRKMMAAAVKAVAGAQPSFIAGSPLLLFEMRVAQRTTGFNNYPYAVSADGKRFLLLAASREGADSPLTVVVNWLASVRK